MPSYDPETNDAKYVRPYDVTGTYVTELLGAYWRTASGDPKNTAAYSVPYPVSGTGVYPGMYVVERGA